jgi:hypothetical protein
LVYYKIHTKVLASCTCAKRRWETD